ncbi:unnamed protein product [Rotaria socialis]|uniref:Rab5 GDP/GTP exchange factor n=1 Tax=Rotaria socialis TaxID=392032 RepID=A0A818E4J2_9BILA|nr:unnamed protein product [Rotaria socialis]CAF3359804.1 unnamed protein product [Rotaria socialis]CAF3452637.1 unnamed protein product [Rotaria socialis]CAF3496777.1 unnamed protein product [Rotaria socialis]
MLKSMSKETINTRSDDQFCRNACGFYGNKIWDGFCSKCYREVYQQAKQIQEAYDGKSNSHEKRRSNITMPNPIRQMVHRAGNLRSSSNSVISALLNDEQTIENESVSKYLEIIIADDARSDIKSQVKTFANNFHKKCSNKNIRLDTLIQEYGTFTDTIKKRIQTNSIYREENEDLIHRVRDYVESIIFSKDYVSVFDRIAIECEEQDLSIQNRISSLHWVTPTMLDVVLNEDISDHRETMYKAVNALIELDAKTTPQGKIHSIMECKSFIEQVLQSTSGTTINADCFLPALIYVVLKAKPPRLYSNIQFSSHFSQPNGEQLYYLANLDSAVRFIELLQAEHLGLSSNDFSLYMRGEPVLPSSCVSLFDYSFENNSNIQQLRNMCIQCDEIEYNSQKFHENMTDFNQHLVQSVTDINELFNDSYTRFAYFEQIPALIKLENIDKKDIDLLNPSIIENKYSQETLESKTALKQDIEQ